MKVGDTIKFDFAGKKKDGTVVKVSPNSVELRVDFDRHKGKLVKRKLVQVDPNAKKAPKEKAKKAAAKPAAKSAEKKGAKKEKAAKAEKK